MIANYDGFSVEINGDSSDELVEVDSISVDGVAYDIHFLGHIAPEFIDWCEEKLLETGTFTDNMYFDED